MKKILFILLFVTLVFSCTRKNTVQGQKELSVLVFITGVTAGSVPYELMAQGALEFASANPNVTVKIYEAGFNQAQWEQQLAEMVSSGTYDIVLGSNPSLPELCVNVGQKFPKQKFIVADSWFEGNPQIRTYMYNQYEQSLFLGYLAGLVTVSDMPYANKQKRIGFLAAQEYPLLTKHMVPGFLEGARLADKEIELDKRIIGSWADANKAADLASAMIDSGVDVFTAIAGGAAQGMIKAASEKKKYVVSYNTNEYKLAEGLVLGCGVMEQKKLVMEILKDALEGKIIYGKAQIVGVKEGYLGFIFDDPAYSNNLPAGIREKFEKFYNDLKEGKINYTIPPL